MNTTTGAQRHNARQDKIWEACQRAKAEQRDTAQHSPIERELRKTQSRLRDCGQRNGELFGRIESLEGERDHYKAHAERLAEALKMWLDGSGSDPVKASRAALAQWEGAKR
jgi:hypothetical protein